MVLLGIAASLQLTLLYSSLLTRHPDAFLLLENVQELRALVWGDGLHISLLTVHSVGQNNHFHFTIYVCRELILIVMEM